MFNIAILGFGVIGKGVYEVIIQPGEYFKRAWRNRNDKLKYILDKFDFPEHPLGDRVTHIIEQILMDDSVSVVVETMGGADAAFRFSKAALEAKKSVVTSNKEVVTSTATFSCGRRRKTE
jgi:homoserine dehydrogenase